MGGLKTITVSPEAGEDGYYAAGAVVTLTPVEATDPQSSFKNWYGDVPEESATAVPLNLVMDAPKTVCADFARNWKYVDGSTTQITDGNWILSISTGNPCSIGVSGRSAYSAGGGALDLTGVYGNLGLTISAIGQSAFSGCSALTSVTMPESVTRLENYAFMNCSKVRSVQLSRALTFIGNCAFDKCSSLASVAPFLPDEVSTIGTGAFRNCNALAGDLKLSCPELKTISQDAFQSTSALSSLDLSESGVPSIGNYAFMNSGLQSLALPVTLEEILQSAFEGCRSLKTVTPFLPASVTSLGVQAFRNCSSITGDLKLSNPALTAIPNNFLEGTPYLNSVDIGGTGVTSIGNCAFYFTKVPGFRASFSRIRSRPSMATPSKTAPA